LYCGWFCIQRENSWISINQNTDVAELNIWLKNKLEELLKYLDEFNDIEKIINKAKISMDNDNDNDVDPENNDNGHFYAFLLRENKKEKELELLKKRIKKQIETLEDELKKLHDEKNILEGKEESLDKEIRLKGIKLTMNGKIRKIKDKNTVLNEIEE
jgi:molybdopterin converting factor small subunit